MAIAITQTQQDLAGVIRDWAGHPGADDLSALADLGVLGIAVPESEGGSGGELTDLAVAVFEAAAALARGPVVTTIAAIALVREPLVRADFIAGKASAAIALQPVADGPVPVLCASAESHLLLAAEPDRWYLVPPGAEAVNLAEREPVDQTHPIAEVSVDRALLDQRWLVPELDSATVEQTVLALLCAEAAGVAEWCVRTAADYARTREQFGVPIGSFQAVKHLCATMLCRAELATAAAWDAVRTLDESAEQRELAVSVAAALCLDAAVENAKDCIQVHGGIGFTWEYPAHRYLRRALVVREFAGGGQRWRAEVARISASGTRRRLRVDAPIEVSRRTEIRETVATVAALEPDQRRDALVDNGLLMPHWPRPYGIEADVAGQLVIDEELELAGVRRPSLVIGSWALATIIRHGNTEQREFFVESTLRGECAWCQLFSEPEAGSDLASLRTKAVRTEGGWLLSGQKVWTSQAREADWGICLARTNPDAPKHRGITYFLVDMRSAGITIRPLREITGDAMFNEVFLDGVFVPDARVVGAVDGGWKLARTTLANERVSMATDSSLGGELEQLLDTQADPVRADRLGRLVAEAVGARVLDLRATLRSMDGQRGEAESSVRKLLGVLHRQEVAELALEVAGTADAAALHEFLMSRCLSIAGGTTQILLSLAAERLLGLPR